MFWNSPIFIATVLLLIMVKKTTSTFKMIVTNGQPANYNNYSNPLDTSATWDECVDYCYNLPACVAVYDNNCQMFQIGQIQTATRNVEEVFAFKIYVDNSTDTCPVDDSGTVGGYTSTNTSYQNYSVSYSDPTWTFSTATVLNCPTNFTLFQRAKGPWCMQVIQHYACCNRTVAAIMCDDSFSSSMLSGIENQAEYDWISALAIPIYQNITVTAVGGVKYNFTGIWLDGTRISSCINVTTSPCNSISGFQFTDPTLTTPPQGYTWLPGEPDGTLAPANMLALRLNSETIFGIDDTPDYPLAGSNTGCWKGYVCGVRPT